MKKVMLVLGVLILGGVALLVGMGQGGVNLGGMSWAWNSEKAVLEEKARSFLEDLQYKDFKKAASYHTFNDQKKADIPKLIERLFQVKPEQLNIRNIRVTEVTLDRSGDRARTFFTATTEVLNSNRGKKDKPNEERDVEGILYWHKRPAAEALPPLPGQEPKVDPNERSPRRYVQVGEGTPYAGEEAGDDGKWFLMLESSLH